VQGPAEKYEKHNKAPRENPSPPEKIPRKPYAPKSGNTAERRRARGRAHIDAD